MRFTALQDFYSDETQSQYVAGLSYMARADDARLRELVPKWIEQGKIVEGGPVAQVMGRE